MAVVLSGPETDMNSHDSNKPARITSIDADRGLVMFLMVAAGMRR